MDLSANIEGGQLRSVHRWRRLLPLSMVALFCILNTYAPFAYEQLNNEFVARVKSDPGTGRGTRSSLVSVAVGGPLRMSWNDQQSSSALGSIARSTILSAPGVLIFWLWLGWFIDTRGRPILPRHIVGRFLLCACYIALLFWSLKWAWEIFDFAMINGAGNVATWARLFSPGFIANSLNWFVGSIWLGVFAFLLLIASIRLWTSPISPHNTLTDDNVVREESSLRSYRGE